MDVRKVARPKRAILDCCEQVCWSLALVEEQMRSLATAVLNGVAVRGLNNGAKGACGRERPVQPVAREGVRTHLDGCPRVEERL